MEQHLANPPKKLFHGICYHHIFLSKNQSKRPTEKQERAALLKYFPKHLAKLHFQFSNGPLNTRIKNIKLVQKLSCKTLYKNFWRLVAAHKRKTVQHFHHKVDNYYSKMNVQCLRMFPNTKILKLCLQDDDGEFSRDELKEQLYWINRISCHLSLLDNLQHLMLSLLGQDLFGPLSKLKNSQRILNHLTVFKIDLTWSHDKEYEILQKLCSSEKALGFITDLSLGMLAGREFFEAFQLLAKSCPKLTHLSFGTSQKSFHLPFQSPYEFGDNILLEDSTYLKCLQNFGNLKTLEIRTCHGLDFLQYCQFPTSLRHLDLSFWKIDWENLKESSSKGLLEFNIQQENLQNLEKLKIGFTEYCEKSDKNNNSQHDREIAINAFLQAFFKRIPTCKQLDLIISCSYLSQTEFRESPFCFDLSKFLGSIEHSGQSLMKLNIGDHSREYCFDQFDAVKPEKFPKLSCLTIVSEISPTIDFENIFNFVPNDNENNQISLDGIKVKSSEELLSLLKRLRKLQDIIARNQKVEVTVYVQDLQQDEEYFERNYEDVKKSMTKLKNLFLTLRIKKSDSKFSEKLKSFKPLFGDLHIRGKNDWERF